MDKPRDEFKLRRRMAIAAFVSINLIAYWVLTMLFTKSCEPMSGNLGAAAGILGPIIVCLSALVGGYGLSVHKRDSENNVKGSE